MQNSRSSSGKIRQVSAGAWTLVDAPDQDTVRLLKRGLTVSTTIGKERNLYLYKDAEDPNRLYIPRMLFATETHDRVRGTTDIPFNGVLRPTQEAMCEEFLIHVFKNRGGIMQAPTGSGKTVMGVYLAHKIAKPTLIIVPTDRIFAQWRAQLKTFSDIEPAIIRGDKCSVRPDTKVAVAMIHSLAQRRYPNWVYNHFGHVIFDEVHVVGAETFSTVVPMFEALWRTGLSATPRRRDGMDKVFRWHIGPVIAKSVRHDLKPRVLYVQYNNEATTHAGCVRNGDLNIGRYTTRVAMTDERNRLLSSFVWIAYGTHHKVLVLSDRLFQLNVIKNTLMRRGISPDDIGIITGAEKKGLDRRIILATYGSAGMGLDIPSLSCVVFATPRADIEQAVGRVMRKKDSEVVPVVVDIVDTASSIMVGWGRKRLRYYRTITDNIEEVIKNGSQ